MESDKNSEGPADKKAGGPSSDKVLGTSADASGQDSGSLSDNESGASSDMDSVTTHFPESENESDLETDTDGEETTDTDGEGSSSSGGPVKKRKSKRKRCGACRKKLTVVNEYECRCGKWFCSTHRYAESHACTFDYKEEGREIIAKANPVVVAAKIQKI